MSPLPIRRWDQEWWRDRAKRYLPLLLPLLLLLGTGLRGIDFGLHWDERPWQIGPVKHMIAARTPLPGYYNYPSFDYWLNLLVLSPSALSSVDGSNIGERLLHAADSHSYLLRLRTVYLLITSLALLWVYLLVLDRGGSTLEALFAASLLGCSWEVAYHLRWVATDGMLMQFAALTVLLAAHAVKIGSERWLIAAAAVAGLGCATKYPGGLLVFPVLLAAHFTANGRTAGQKAILLGKLAFISLFVYLAVTPATILQPVKVAGAVLYEMKHYATGHGGHTVGRGLEHAWRICSYFASVLFSPYLAIALLFFALAVAGVAITFARSWRQGTVLLVFPLLYFLYFASQRAMVVRNLLAVAPFLAIMAACGATGVLGYLSRHRRAVAERSFQQSWSATLWVGLLGLSLGLNAYWIFSSAERIAQRRTDRFVREAADYLRRNSNTKFLLSPRMKWEITLIDPSLGKPEVDPAQADAFMLYAREGMLRWHDWPASRRGLTEACFGPREVNFDMYPNWWGDDRIVVINRDRAEEIGLHVAGISPDIPPQDLGSSSAFAAQSNVSGNALISSWTLPGVDPRLLIARGDAEAILGPLDRGPLSGGWELDGAACTYLGSDGSVVSLAVISTAAFDLQRRDPGSAPIPGSGLNGYAVHFGPFQDIRLFARSRTSAVIVDIAGSSRPSDQLTASAGQLAVRALDRLDGKPD